MKKYMIAVMMVMTTVASVNAQIGNQNYAYNDDRYYYNNDFDWHWDVRVKISNGIQQGLITQNESNRLYGILQNVEQKEYAYEADGLYSTWEQQEIWNDVIYINQCLGVALNDYDRNFYGFDAYGDCRPGYNRWFYQGGYDFNRFDKRGFGSIRIGYAPRPNYNGWCRDNNNQIAQQYYIGRSNYVTSGNNQIGVRDSRNYGSQSRMNSDYNRNGSSGNDYGRNSHGNNGRFQQGNDGRPDRVQPNNNGGFQQGNVGRPERAEPNNNGGLSQENGEVRPERGQPNNNGGLSQRNGGGRPERAQPNNNGGGSRPERTESNNRSDNGNRGGGNRSEAPQGGGNGEIHEGRGPR